MSEFEYIGNELEIAQYATNWKTYFTHTLKKYVQGDVLEVGAGLGANIDYFVNKNATIQSWTCVEPDTKFSKILENNAFKIDNKTVNGTIDDVDKNNLYDTIIYIDVIEHIEDDQKELNKAKKHLKKGGNLIILVPAFNFLFSPFDKAIGHYRRYDKKMLTMAMPKDLNKVRLFYLDALGACASLTNKLILKQSYPTKKQILQWDRLIVPSSKIVDKFVFNTFGKSLIGIWKK